MNRSLSALWLLAFGGAAAALIFSLWLLASAGEPQNPSAATAAAAASASPGYYAALSGNYVVIYLNGRAEPVLVTDIDARTLPDADQQKLAQGIPLAGADDVNQLLEDYSG